MAEDYEIVTGLLVAGAGIAAAIAIFFIGRRVAGSRSRREASRSLATPILAHENDGPSEKRSGFRRGGSQVAVVLSVQEPKPEQHSGWVVDRCPGGLGIVTDEPIPAGTVVKVRTTKSVGITVEMVVRQSRQDNRCCFVGCEFVNRPSTEVLWQFG
jgi:hypothetical protein